MPELRLSRDFCMVWVNLSPRRANHRGIQSQAPSCIAMCWELSSSSPPSHNQPLYEKKKQKKTFRQILSVDFCISLWRGRNLLTKMGSVKLILFDRGHRGVSAARKAAESQPRMSVTHIDLWMLCSWFHPVALCRETLESQALLMENNISR